MQDQKELTGEDSVARMTPEAVAEAQAELAQVKPGAPEPFRMGDEGAQTELDEDPISEGGSSRQSRP